MEWSREKTLKLIQLLQINANLWNPTLCDSRKDKQKRKEELRNIASTFSITVPETTKKIQHLRTQYNREAAKEARANAEVPSERFVSNWYAFENLHFLKDSSKPYRVIVPTENSDLISQLTEKDAKTSSPPSKIPRIENTEPTKTTETNLTRSRDEFTVFGEYVANELRTLKGEKNLLVAKKKIQDAIFEVKIGMLNELRNPRSDLTCSNFSTQNGKIYTPMTTSTQIQSIAAETTTPTNSISEIIINGSCHYPNFKVDNQ